MLRRLFIFTGLLLSLTTVSYAKGDKVIPCAHPIYHTLNFYLGEWQVYHKESNKLMAYDRVNRTLKGCAVQQSFFALDDYFSSPGVPFRMSGKGLFAFNGQEWTHLWVDNQGGTMYMTGGFEDEKLVLSTKEEILGYHYQITWEKVDNATLNNTAKRYKIEDNTGLAKDQIQWETLYEVVYRRNSNLLKATDE